MREDKRRSTVIPSLHSVGLHADDVAEVSYPRLAIRIDRRLKAVDMIDVLSDLFILRGVPGHIRSDNGPELVAKAVQAWIAAVGAGTAFITLGSPWENGYVESFNARLRDELLDGETLVGAVCRFVRRRV